MMFYNLSAQHSTAQHSTAQHSTAGGNFPFFSTYIKTCYKKRMFLPFFAVVNKNQRKRGKAR
ncbi:hypothetical protein [Lactococcus petauri]|uniref:hypothetical protein n=1 Tax=Lactococcus petauri TaxID=1940789 RepID=UPI003853811E